MKAHKNTDKQDDPEVPNIPQRKHVAKPWVISFMYSSTEHLSNSFFNRDRKVGEWIVDNWQKFINSEDAIKELNKRARSYFGDKPGKISELWQFAHKEFRLENVETKEIIPIIVGDNEIHKKNEKD